MRDLKESVKITKQILVESEKIVKELITTSNAKEVRMCLLAVAKILSTVHTDKD